ncbi:sensor histidine kinase [Companilactobacillus jidongensis]|uniref:sensor histidine kinase n=1 Tax=Companilactobacillus jidongensis TaxID=2486006 RepID=UPI0013DDBE25|nr:GHKL domain-containing protein [Companilactobacillus jidongensis]
MLIISYFLLFRHYKPNWTNRILWLLIGLFTNAFSQSLAWIISVNLFNYHNQFIESLACNIILNYVFALFITYMGIYLVRRLSQYINFNDPIIITIITSSMLILLVGFTAFTTISRILNVQLEYMRTNIVLTVIIFIFIFLGTLYYIAGYIKQQQAIRELEKIKESNLYIKELEDNYDEMRKFKHDYKNLLLSLSVLLENDDDKYAGEKVKDLLKDSSMDINDVPKLNNPNLFKIQDELVRGIIISKMITAKNLGIKVTTEVDPNIRIARSYSVSITRILGILFDNAIEACRKGAEPTLNFALIDDKYATEFIVNNNTAPNTKVDINKIFTNGFSTKENHNGIGLANVQELVNKKPNFFLNTKFENDEFTVILTIEKEN